MKRVLVSNIFGIGDVLFTTPLIKNLKKAGDISVDYLSNKRTKDILEDNPDIEKVFVYEKDDLMKLKRKSLRLFLSAIYKLYVSMRNRKYDTVFDFTLAPEFGFLFMLMGVKNRIGFNYKNRGIFLTLKKELAGFEDKHVIDYYLDLLSFMGIEAKEKSMCISVKEEIKSWAREYTRSKGRSKNKLVAIIPGGGESWGPNAYRKRWPAGHFAKIADAVCSAGGDVIILGSENEGELCGEIFVKMEKKPLFISTEFNLRQYTAILSECDLVICNDGGPLHIAAALGLKTVSIFGPVDDRVYGPYPRDSRHRVIRNETIECRPCYNRFKLPPCDYNVACLTEIAPEEVVTSALELLGGFPPA